MTTATPIDRKREHRSLYSPPAHPVLVDVPEMNFLMIDGTGDPATSDSFRDAIATLYAASFTAKFLIRDALGLDYTVMPLEALWWSDDIESFVRHDADAWLWTAMIAQPEELTAEMVSDVVERTSAKRPLLPLSRLRFERFDEGRAAQVMYVGPYSDEGPTIAALHSFVADQRLQLQGKHHEIYIGDPRRTAPERLKTVIRHPVR